MDLRRFEEQYLDEELENISIEGLNDLVIFEEHLHVVRVEL